MTTRTIVTNRPQGRFNFAKIKHMNTFINYLKDTFAEMKHISWPTQKQAVVYTALVIGVSIVVSLFVGLLDYVFSQGLDLFLK